MGKRKQVDYWKIVEDLLPSYLLDNVNRNMQEAMAKSLAKKHLGLIDGCIIDQDKRFSDLRFYFGEKGAKLIETGIKRCKLDIKQSKSDIRIEHQKVGENPKIQKKDNLLDFIKKYDSNS